ncbi:MAG: bifunctional phosphopantothenoylcysteine decarboxylase/phosphopantothenate--cysteine ligase CoaBC, partial [Candidatus Adiutrix sp.]|nr:bifunctional phosphopantothenoylcysteine decarboxylase/phosphopantothenate--cysteine ligase CoaBC [Candidatus Adiutrix sp.]
MSAPKKNNPEVDTHNWASPLSLLAGRRLALVVTGGVAAYKGAELARTLVRAGAEVRAVLTENAARFVTPLTFEALTRQPAYVDMWGKPQFDIEHISLADWAEAVVVAPATANFLAKMAWGLADDFASTFLLASPAPALAAPAMNSRMLAAPATVANLATLAERGVTLVNSQSGLLACGTVGDGRLAEPEVIALMAARALSPNDFQGMKVAVSAGSTREAWDDIRFLANRSTGKMGRDVALAAWLRGAEVTLVAGPGVASPPSLPQMGFVSVESTSDMLEALRGIDFNTLIMAAAPADFRPAERVAGKVK